MYQKRKQFLIDAIEKKLVKLSNRARYIQETLSGVIDLRRKSAAQVAELLTTMKFVKIDDDFKYLVKMPMDSVTEENVKDIMTEKSNTEDELKRLRATTVEKMWLSELDALDKEYDKYKIKRERIQAAGGDGNKNKKTTTVVKKKIVTAAK